MTDRSVSAILSRYDLAEQEFHTAWVLRKYLEQTKVPGFASLNFAQRRAAIGRERNAYLLKLQASSQSKMYRQVKKTFAHENAYIHLTLDERKAVTGEISGTVQGNVALDALFGRNYPLGRGLQRDGAICGPGRGRGPGVGLGTSDRLLNLQRE